MNQIIICLFVMMMIHSSNIFVNSKSFEFNSNNIENQPHHIRHHKGSPNMWTILGQPVKSEHLSKADRDDRHKSLHRINEENLTTSLEQNKVISSCPKCHHKNDVQIMSEEQLTELRIEYVKNQILKKLKLKEPPKVSLNDLPKPVIEGATMGRSEEDSLTGIPDEFYAKTTQKIFFPQLLGNFLGFFLIA